MKWSVVWIAFVQWIGTIEVVGEENCGCNSLSRDSIETEHIIEQTSLHTTDSPTYLQDAPHEGMVRIEGGEFIMGFQTDEEGAYPIERNDGEFPARRVFVSSFYMDITEVTNQQFAKFISESKYIPDSHRYGWSFVFLPFADERVREEVTQVVQGAPWWGALHDAHWNQPLGVNSSISHIMDHPVVHVSWNDALEYCKWYNKRLPTEAGNIFQMFIFKMYIFVFDFNEITPSELLRNNIKVKEKFCIILVHSLFSHKYTCVESQALEWEYAARGGLHQKMFPWGDELHPNNEHRMNVWQGVFPDNNTMEDGYASTAPALSYQPNAFGLYNMCGNVWEWTMDWFTKTPEVPPPGKRLRNPTGPKHGTEKVQKGGSFLCHRSYCHRYRTSARIGNTPDSTAVNVGFRCVQ